MSRNRRLWSKEEQEGSKRAGQKGGGATKYHVEAS